MNPFEPKLDLEIFPLPKPLSINHNVIQRDSFRLSFSTIRPNSLCAGVVTIRRLCLPSYATFIEYNLHRSETYTTPLGSTEGLAFSIPAATLPPATGLVSLLAPVFTVKVALGKPSRFGLPAERISRSALPIIVRTDWY